MTFVLVACWSIGWYSTMECVIDRFNSDAACNQAKQLFEKAYSDRWRGDFTPEGEKSRHGVDVLIDEHSDAISRSVNHNRDTGIVVLGGLIGFLVLCALHALFEIISPRDYQQHDRNKRGSKR